MYKSGAIKNYNFGNKKNWRRTVWNDLLKNTAGKEKHEIIIYLPGPNDYDRSIAIDKGVPNTNLIAVDMNLDNVLAVRNNGGFAIHGEIGDVLENWNKHVPVCCIFLDYCAGIVKYNFLTSQVFKRKPFYKSVIAVNLKRGRDHFSQDFRNFLTKHQLNDINLLKNVSEIIAKYSENNNNKLLLDRTQKMFFDLSPKHRGFQWIMLEGLFQLDGLLKSNTYAIYYKEFTQQLKFIVLSLLYKDPIFRTYKSGNQNFDTVIYKPSGNTPEKFLTEEGLEIVENLMKDLKNYTVVRTIAATLAVRTKHLNNRV